MVVVAGVEGNVLSAGLGDGANDVDRLVAIEWRDLYGHDPLDFEKLPPEAIRQRAAADRRLEIETDKGKHVGDGTAVFETGLILSVAQRSEAEQTGVITQRANSASAIACTVLPQTPAIRTEVAPLDAS